MKEYITVFTAEMARHLLKKDFTIVDIKAHRGFENASVFVFKNDDGLMTEIRKFKGVK